MDIKKVKLLTKIFIIIGVLIIALMWVATFLSRRPPAMKKERGVTAEKPLLEVPTLGIPTSEPTQEPIMVRTFRVKRTNFRDTLPAMGTIKGAHEVELRFEISGVVSSIAFREGDKITKGAVIATLDEKDGLLRLAYTKSKFEAAQAAYMTAQKRLEIFNGLYEVGAVIRSKVEEMELECERLRLEAQTVSREVALAESELNKTKLLAPRDGVMGSRDVEVGEFVTPNTKIGSLIDTDEVYVEVGIVERDINRLKVGQRAKINVDTYPGKDFSGTIDNIFPLVEGRSRTLTTKIKLTNPQGSLLPGMFARAEIFLVELENAVIIPSNILIMVSPEATVVPVVVSDSYSMEEVEKGLQPGTAELRQVAIGYMSADYAQIVNGLAEGELVVIESQGELKDGVPVRVVGVEEPTL